MPRKTKPAKATPAKKIPPKKATTPEPPKPKKPELIPNEEWEEDEEEAEEEEIKISNIARLDAPRILPDPVDLTKEDLRRIEDELALIRICWPEITSPKFEDRTHFPPSYLQNSKKEKLLLAYCENFRRQFCFKFPNRKPLYLVNDNECGMKKMVCTTIRPTTLPYPEIETWQNLVDFTGKCLKYEPLDVPTLLPKRLHSPHTTFLRQSGHSFELATALCSLLIGLGYDAYVVSGYATRDVTLRIMSRVDSPYPIEKKETKKTDDDVVERKYAMRPPRDLRSKFLLMMEQREIDKVKAEEERLAEIERKRVEEEEKPPFDELQGLRVHGWILLLPNFRPVEKAMFIEPSTGRSYPLDSNLYCGIESVWNNVNYWVNMQDCTDGIGSIDYDLSKSDKWEHLLIGEPIIWRKTELDLNMDENEANLAKIQEEKHLDMPTSWSLKISIPHEVLKLKFPDGKMKTWFKRTLVEEFAPYVQKDGLVTKITMFKDFECTDAQTLEEVYENRNDKMYRREYNFIDDSTIDFFKTGRADGVIKYFYYKSQDPSYSDVTIEFNREAKADCLVKLVLSPELTIEEYVDREDFLYRRDVVYAKKGCPPPGMVEGHRKIVLSFSEKFNRNEELQASQDVAFREFDLIERKIKMKYHYGEGKVTASTREFIKPPLAEMGEGMRFNPELTSGYQAEIGAKPPRQMQLFLLLEEMLREEEKSFFKIRGMEDQIAEFLMLRAQEILHPKLDVSLFNIEQNKKLRKAMLDKEQELLDYKEKEVEEEIDFLAPYLAQVGNPKFLNNRVALRIWNECLSDFKKLLLSRANAMQKQFEKITENLAEKQRWFKLNHDLMNEQEESKYFNEINDINLVLQTLEIRLTRHRDLSTERYQALLNYLRLHPLLQKIKK